MTSVFAALLRPEATRTMLIRFFASIRNITGVKEIEWGEPSPTLGDLLHSLSARYGPQFRNWVFEGEDLGSSAMVVINGDDVRHQGGLKTHLRSTDVISILPIMAGGGGGVSSQRSAFSYQLPERTRGDVGTPKGVKPAVNGRFCVALSD